VRLHRVAFDFFGRVPDRVVLDNLRAAIVRAALYDPEVQRSYRECAEHYGFLIAPCRPRAPAHKAGRRRQTDSVAPLGDEVNGR
jgi:transposase